MKLILHTFIFLVPLSFIYLLNHQESILTPYHLLLLRILLLHTQSHQEAIHIILHPSSILLHLLLQIVLLLHILSQQEAILTYMVTIIPHLLFIFVILLHCWRNVQNSGTYFDNANAFYNYFKQWHWMTLASYP